MQVRRVVQHPELHFLAKDFDRQRGFMVEVELGDRLTVEIGTYLHWKGRGVVDIAIDVSCMSGCSESCKFCAAGLQKDAYPIAAQDVVEQVELALRFARAGFRDFFVAERWRGEKPLVTVSFSGTGEPSLRASVVVESIPLIRKRFEDEVRLQFAVSTVGKYPGALEEWVNLGLQSLQVSLHAATDTMREEVLGQTVPIAVILGAVDDFSAKSPETEIKINYLPLRNITDRDEDAQALADLLAEEQRSRYFLKISRLNETASTLQFELKPPDELRFHEFVVLCKKLVGRERAYAYGPKTPIGISCGQLAAYASRSIPFDVAGQIERVYELISSGEAALFLGAGASQGLWSATALARQLFDNLKLGVKFDETDLGLNEVVDIYDSYKLRSDVRDLLSAAMSRVNPPQELTSLVTLPWRTIFTTNYDKFVERAFKQANKDGLTSMKCRPIRDDSELHRAFGEGVVPLIKLHGCITMPNGMVISGSDYLNQFEEGREHLLKLFAVEALCSPLVFVGYGFHDHRLGEIIARAHEARQNARPAFAIIPRDDLSAQTARILGARFGVELVAATIEEFVDEIERIAAAPVVLVSGSTKQKVEGSTTVRKPIAERLESLASELAPRLRRLGARVITGATAKDKFGYILASKDEMEPTARTYVSAALTAGRPASGDEVKAMVRPTEIPATCGSDIADHLVRLCSAAVIAGGGYMTLIEYQRAASKSRLTIPLNMGDGRYASDIIHSMLSDHAKALALLDSERGFKREGPPQLASKLITVERLERLHLRDDNADEVAETIEEILLEYRMAHTNH